MEYYINVLAEQGITNVAIWQPPSKQEGGAIEGVKAHPEDSTSSQVARLQVKDSSNAEDNDGGGRQKKEIISGKSSSGSSSGTDKTTSTSNLRRKSSGTRHRGDASKSANEDAKIATGSAPVGVPGSGTIPVGGVAGSTSAASSVHNKLEQDYIQMYLG